MAGNWDTDDEDVFYKPYGDDPEENDFFQTSPEITADPEEGWELDKNRDGRIAGETREEYENRILFSDSGVIERDPEMTDRSSPEPKIGDDYSGDYDSSSRNDDYCIDDQKEEENRKVAIAKAADLRNMHFFESWGLVGIVFLVYATTTVLILMGNVSWLPFPDRSFWCYLCVFFGVFGVLAVAGGWLVVKGYILVMWARKNVHIQSFVLPFPMFYAFPFEKTITTYLLTMLSAFLAYVPLIAPIRENRYTNLLHYAYASFNRVEDQPFVLVYAITQNMATFAVMIPLGYVIAHVLGHPDFLNIPIMTVAFGDGCAELVGRKMSSWGLAHNYKTTAMWSTKRYRRSVEGNICVFAAALISILVTTLISDPGVWDTGQIVAGCLIIPIMAAVVEAKAPHSWDNALLLSSIGIAVIIIFGVRELKMVGVVSDWFRRTSGTSGGDEIFDVYSMGML